MDVERSIGKQFSSKYKVLLVKILLIIGLRHYLLDIRFSLFLFGLLLSVMSPGLSERPPRTMAV